MKELLEPVLKHLPNYIPAFGSLVTEPKAAIIRWVEEEKGDLTRPLVFVGLSVSLGFLLQLQRVGKDDFATLVVSMAMFKILSLVLFAAIIHKFFRIFGGYASFAETFSAYLYIVSPLYLVGVILRSATHGVLYAYDPVIGAATRLDPSALYGDVERMRTFEGAEPGLALAYNLLGLVTVFVVFAWLTVCWGAFRKLHGVKFWQSSLIGIATLITGYFFVLGMNFVLRGIVAGAPATALL
jgi:Yip1 domain